MALKRLTIEEMIQISAPWVTSGDDARRLIEAIPLLAALLPKIEGAHNAILAVRPAIENPRVRALTEEAAELDVRHDTLVEGLYLGLSMLALLSPNGAELIRLRDVLLPEGLMHKSKTYRGQAGHGELVRSRLDGRAREEMAAVVLYDRTLGECVDEWLGVTGRLGEIEQERARLSEPSASAAAQINDARLDWIRAVNAIVANAALAGVDDATDHLLFSELRIAERTADRRGRTRSSTKTSDESTSEPE